MDVTNHAVVFDRTACDRTACDRPAFDRSTALKKLLGSEQLLRDVAEAFFEQAPQLVSDIRVAAARADYPSLERLAHTLKGSAGVLAATQVVPLAQQIENDARNHDISSSLDAFCELDDAVDDLIAAVQNSF